MKIEDLVVAAFERERQELEAMRNPKDKEAFMTAFRKRQLQLKGAIGAKKKFHDKYIKDLGKAC